MAELNERGMYDADADQRPARHDLKAAENNAASEPTTGGSSGDVDSVRGKENFGYNANGDDGDKSDKFYSADDKNGKNSIRARLKRNRKKSIIAGTGIGAGMAIALAIFFIAIPLKVEHMVNNLQNRFFANSQQASEEAIEKMTIKYFKRHVLPDYKKCGSTISSNCKVTIVAGGANPVTQLYKSWSTVKLEHTLATKYNFEVSFNTKSNSWKVKAPGVQNSDGLDLGRDGENIDAVFTNRGEVRKAFRDSIQGETRWKNIYYRFKVGSLLEQKYGIKRCMVFCGARDQFAEKKAEKKNAAKILIAQRVIAPRTETLGLAMSCLFDPGCDPNTTSTDGTETNGGEPSSDVENDMRAARAQNRPNFGSSNPEQVDKMIKDYNTITEKGYSGYAVGKVLEKIGLSQVSDRVTSAVPVVGWVTALSDLTASLDNAGPKVKKLSYLTNSGAAVSLYSAYRTYGDEIHTGNVDPTEIGSFSDSLSPGNRGAESDPIKGGTASAESSPLYAAVINGKSYSTPDNTSLLNDILPSAYAAEQDPNTSSNDYQCKDNKPLSGMICPEEKLGTGNNTLNNIDDFLESPGIKQVKSIAGAISSALKPINDLIGGAAGFLIGVIPGADSLTKLASDVFTPAFESLTKDLIPDPFGTNMSGARTFNMMAAGANVAGNDACTDIGCSTVPKDFAAATIRRQQEDAKNQFQSQPILARIFSTSDQYSLTSRLAMKVPINTYSSAQQNIASLMANPFTAFAKTFGSIFNSPRAFADFGLGETDPFNIGDVGFPDIPSDLEAYWDVNNCGDTSENGPNAKWAKAASTSGGGSVNPETGMPIHTTTNPCKLIKSATGSAGGSINSDLLEEDEKTILNGGTTTTDTNSPDEADAEVSGNAQELAKQIIDAGNLTGDPRYMKQIQDVAKGTGDCNVNPTILKMLVGVTVNEKHKVFVSSLNRKCTGVLVGAGKTSSHYINGGGHAIDITFFDGKLTNGGGAVSKAFLDSASKYLPKGTGYGQQTDCGSLFKVPEGSIGFDDSCDHQHIQVPVEASD